jgi:hypothetical protein
MREGVLLGEAGGPARLKRRMVERVVAGVAHEMRDDLEPLMALLRRLATEAARDEARMFCEDLVARDHYSAPPPGYHFTTDDRLVA